jgi:hypothetical protein
MHTVAQKDTLSPLEVVVDGLANIHTTLDADQDGTLSMADTAIHMETASKALDADADGALSYTDLRDTITTALDANDDQHLTVQDVAHHAHQAADLNGDGVCSFSELVLCACSFAVAWFLARRHYTQKMLDQTRHAEGRMRRYIAERDDKDRNEKRRIRMEQARLVQEKKEVVEQLAENERLRLKLVADNAHIARNKNVLEGRVYTLTRERETLERQQAELSARKVELDKQVRRNSAVMQQRIDELRARECAFCHAALATAVNRPCGCRLLCRECSDTFRGRNGPVCPNPNCPNTVKTTVDDDLEKTTIACTICSEEWETNCVFKVSEGCDHLICIGCMVENVKVALCDRSMLGMDGLKCPMPHCTHFVKNKIHQMKVIAQKVLPDPASRTDAVPLTDGECEQYVRFMEEARIPVERRVWCRNPECGPGAVAAMDVGERRHRAPHKFVCVYCESEAYALCTQCKELHHPDVGDCARAKAARESTSKSDVLIQLTSKPCPSCTTSITHFHGHGCHHIKPGGGCPSCHTHWCFACGTASATKVDNNYCGSDPRCRLFCQSEGIHRHLDDSSGYPIDRRCSCPICPDCRPEHPCPSCDGGCVVCAGSVPPGKLVGRTAAWVNEKDPGISAGIDRDGINRDGVRCLLGDGARYYCGRKVRSGSCPCGGCDDYCGPNNGCPCEACLEYYRNHVKNPPASASANFNFDFQGDY